MTGTHPSLTQEGRNRIQTAISQYEDDKDLFEDLLTDILGAELRFGKGHTFLFPRTLRGVDLATGGKAEKYVLKICYSHIKGKQHNCQLEQEAWIWEEAVRRGDDHLFAPIAEIDEDAGWSVMEYGYYLSELDYTSLPQHQDGISTKELADQLENEARIKGWVPYDTEIRAINGEPVLIDYEKVYPEDMFEGLYIHSFPNFYEHELYSREVLRAARNRSGPDTRTRQNRRERH